MDQLLASLVQSISLNCGILITHELKQFMESVLPGLANVRPHDMKHTFGRRLRAVGVPLETRKVLLGHKNGDITIL